MDFSGLLKRAGRFASDNSPAILTAVAVTGTVTTAYLTGKASFKAAEILREANEPFESNHPDYKTDPVEFREAALLVWREYIPAATTGALTIAAVFALNHVGTKRTAALAAAYAISEKAFDEYKHKIVEKVGEKKERAYRTEIAQDRITNDPPPEDLVYLEGGRSQLCCDLFTGRYFMSDVETIRQAENQINYRLVHDYYASLTDFYEQIGLPKTTMSDDFGWNVDKMLDVEIDAVLTPSGKACVTIDFRVAPIRGFSRLS